MQQSINGDRLKDMPICPRAENARIVANNRIYVALLNVNFVSNVRFSNGSVSMSRCNYVVVVIVVAAPTVVAVAEGSLGLSTVDILTDRLIV